MDRGADKADPVIPDSLLSSLERDFNEMMNALSDDGSLTQFRIAYETMYGALKASHESEKRLMNECQSLTQELLSNAAKMQAAVKLSQGDHTTIEALKQEVEKAWSAVDSADEKDRQASETAKVLEEEVKKLQLILEDISVLPAGHASTLEEIKLENKRLEVASEELTKKIDACTREMQELTLAEKEAEAAAAADSAEMQSVMQRMDVIKQEVRREKNSNDRTKFQLQELTRSTRARENELHELEAKEKELQKSIDSYTEQIAQVQRETAVLDEKLEVANKQLYHTEQTYNDTVDTTADINERMQEITRQMHLDEQKLAEMQKEATRVMRVKENNIAELSKLKVQHDELVQQQREIDQENAFLDRETKRVDLESKRMKEVQEFMAQQAVSAEKKEKEEQERLCAWERQIASEEEDNRELEEAIARERAIVARLETEIAHEERERDRYLAEASRIEVQQRAAMDELQLATLAAEDAQRKMQEKEAKFAEQQAKYEQVRVERNQLSTQLANIQDEIAEMKQKTKMVNHQIKQYDEEIKLNEKKIAEEEAREKILHEQLAREQNMEREYTEQITNSTKESEVLKEEIRRHVHLIEKHDKELAVQQANAQRLNRVHDMLNDRLSSRNEELALLYEKLNIEQAALREGERVYQSQLEEMRKLRAKLNEERRQATLAKNQTADMKELRMEVQRLESEIEADETAIMVLSEELEDPQSQTRWRHLGGKDPAPEELQARLTRLQKQLIIDSEETLEQDMQLQEKERLAIELQSILDRQPGIEVAGQLNTYRQALSKKNAEMKQAAAELNMTSAQMNELKYEAERLRREIHTTKREYYTTKLKMKEFLQSNGIQTKTVHSDDDD